MGRAISKYSAGLNWACSHVVSACAFGMVLGSSLTATVGAQESEASLVEKEVARRSQNVAEARKLLAEGDVHYKTESYQEAVEAFGRAFALIPRAGLTGELRFAAADRYAQAVVVYGKELARFGKYEEARALLELVLESDVAPGNLAAMTLLAQLDDPIRYNQVLTPQHVQNIQSVAHWLRKAEGYYELGQFDESLVAYEEVLAIDKFNKAARRGMERVTARVSDYQKAAYDHYRSDALGQVDSSWESFVGRKAELIEAPEDGQVAGDRIQEIKGTQLRRTVIPVVDIQDMRIEEVYELIRAWAREYDVSEFDDSKKGMNFVLRIGSEDSAWGNTIRNKRVNLQLRNVPLEQVLDYVSKATGTQWRLTDHAVLVTPSGSVDDQIYSRSFRVPPNFMQEAALQGGGSNDPFAETQGSSALRKKVTAMEFLKQLGVAFPEGATAQYIPASNMLRVSNTSSNLDLVEEYVRTYSQKESVQVVLKVTIVDIAQSDLEELGFDWLLGQATVSDNKFLGGGSVGSGDNVTAIDPVSNPGLSPITAGNRSGDSMFTSGLLDRTILGPASESDVINRASGVLQLNGQLNDGDFQMIMRALDQKKGVSRLVTPSIISRAGEKATFYSGQEFIYSTEYEPPELPNSVAVGADGVFPVTPATPTAFETRLLGVNLEAESTVSEDRHYIDLRLNNEIVNFDGFINYGSPIVSTTNNPVTGDVIEVDVTENAILMPVFRKVGINTSVTVQDGATIVIGGLMQQAIEDVEDKVPVLGNLPFVGRMFSSQGVKNTKRAMVIFVKTELVDPTGKPWRER